jgi:hypothetical protein
MTCRQPNCAARNVDRPQTGAAASLDADHAAPARSILELAGLLGAGGPHSGPG